MTPKQIANRLYDQRAKFRSQYRDASTALSTPGVDVESLRERQRKLSESIAEIDRQLDTLECR